MSVTIIVEITTKILRNVSTQEVSSSGSSLVLAKITYECIEMSSYEIKITNCVCGRTCNGCVHTQRTPQQHHIYGHTHTICDFNQFYELFDEF